jgi:hypothetical protein
VCLLKQTYRGQKNVVSQYRSHLKEYRLQFQDGVYENGCKWTLNNDLTTSCKRG